MTWTVVFEPPAQAEIAQAFDWYEQRSYGLGGEFLRVVAAATERLSREPETFRRPASAFAASCQDAFRTRFISS